MAKEDKPDYVIIIHGLLIASLLVGIGGVGMWIMTVDTRLKKLEQADKQQKS